MQLVGPALGPSDLRVRALGHRAGYSELRVGAQLGGVSFGGQRSVGLVHRLRSGHRKERVGRRAAGQSLLSHVRAERALTALMLL